jgi:hypothetical protein
LKPRSSTGCLRSIPGPGGFKRGGHNPPDCDLVFVDETSTGCFEGMAIAKKRESFRTANTYQQEQKSAENRRPIEPDEPSAGREERAEGEFGRALDALSVQRAIESRRK